ncbi:hypothetical protein CSOJ01_01220 [Colletotrichum sojae]|uniref:Uncharacterized protein n=1 Tax=Colletotrichum sojae TaxID=2175907 RepID=A0A8H6N4Z0_9PEZI|nr:hypothetical protein CSOJ01_01220 [Colletotrichum sojae]
MWLSGGSSSSSSSSNMARQGRAGQEQSHCTIITTSTTTTTTTPPRTISAPGAWTGARRARRKGERSMPWHAYPPGMAWHGSMGSMAHELLLCSAAAFLSRIDEP